MCGIDSVVVVCAEKLRRENEGLILERESVNLEIN